MSTIDAGYQPSFSPNPANWSSRDKLFSLRGRVILGSIFAVLLLGGIGGWAMTAKLSGAVIGTGSVLVDEDIKVVQHPDGGVLREIGVREGDFVTIGQVLLRLEDAELRAERAIIAGQLVELQAQRARLIAETEGLDLLAIPVGLVETYPSAEQIIAGEERLFLGNLARHQSQRDQMALQVDQLREEINGLIFQRNAVIAEFELAQIERDRLRTLSNSNLIETSRLSDAERDVARLQGQMGELDTAIARAEVRISDVELRILEHDGTRRTDAQRELRLVEAEISQTEERLAATEARYARTEILSPATGTVNELNVTTVGGVISPAERLITIVPEDADLTIEFRIAINDIDQVRVGQEATLRFSAFNQRTTPEVSGEIIRVSAAAQRDAQSGEQFYLAQVVANEEEMAISQNQLVPGMPVEVFVETQQQLAIAYFLKPFTDQITRAFREE